MEQMSGKNCVNQLNHLSSYIKCRPFSNNFCKRKSYKLSGWSSFWFQMISKLMPSFLVRLYIKWCFFGHLSEPKTGKKNTLILFLGTCGLAAVTEANALISCPVVSRGVSTDIFPCLKPTKFILKLFLGTCGLEGLGQSPVISSDVPQDLYLNLKTVKIHTLIAVNILEILGDIAGRKFCC